MSNDGLSRDTPLGASFGGFFGGAEVAGRARLGVVVGVMPSGALHGPAEHRPCGPVATRWVSRPCTERPLTISRRGVLPGPAVIVQRLRLRLL